MSSGNTYGKVVGDTPKSTAKAAAANPPVDEKNILEEAQDATKRQIDDWVESTGYNQGAMVAGAIATAVAEVVMPTAWWELIPVGKAAKILKKGGEAVGVLKKGEKTAEAANDAKKGGKEAQIKKRPKQKVKCFCPGDHAQGGRDEYERQLDRQQEGINSMNADDYLRERRACTGKNPCSNYSPAAGGKTKFRDRDVTKNARAKRLKDLSADYSKEMHSKGMGPAKADKLGEAKAKREVGNQDPLHNQDMVAGGDDVIGSGGKLTGADFGESKVNRHIGSQWNGDRIKGIDAEACQMQKEGRGQDKMNVELRVCGKHEAKKAGCKPPKGKK